MLWVGLAGILFICMLVAVCISYIRGEVHFSRVKDNDQLTIEIRALFDLVCLRYAIPVIQFKSFSEGVMIKSGKLNASNNALQEERKEHITKEKVIQYYDKIKLMLENTMSLYGWMKQTLNRVQMTKLNWVTRIGVGDAPETAITTGAVWAIKSSLLGFLIQYIDLQAKPHVLVVPQYNQPQFYTEFNCSGRIRVWFALISGLRLIVRVMKVKGGLRTWYQLYMKSRVKTAS